MRKIGLLSLALSFGCTAPKGDKGAEGAAGPAGSQGPAGTTGTMGTMGTMGGMGTPGATGPAGPQGVAGPAGAAATWASLTGGSPATAGASCEALRTAGVTLSGAYYVNNPASADPARVGQPVLVYCDQVSEGGGWAMVYNSILAPNTLDFWSIPYANRLSRRGRPELHANFYDGALYQTAPTRYLDVIEDIQGQIVTVFVATTTGINNTTMRFDNPAKVSGDNGPYSSHFAAGWSAPDYDGDTYAADNCATRYGLVTQHYGECWSYNLGGDADASGGDNSDQRLGPHANITSLGLASDGSPYTRVRRITRFVKW